MSHTTRTAAVLSLVLSTTSIFAQDRTTQPAPRLADRSLRNTDYTAARVEPAPTPTPSPAPTPAPAPQPAVDPYGFAQILNNYRASAGLPPVAYDANLAGWAASNNAAQCSYGLGHHVNPGFFQNSGWNYADAWSCAVAWMNSPAHRDTLLSPSASSFGIAYGPGPYWTLNVR